jgi:MOSC domain-containing protein YiiM
MNPIGTVVAVAKDGKHRFSKPTADEITIIAGLGVEGDAHAGTTVKHRSRVRRDPTTPNLRQIHLIHQELLDEVAGYGYTVAPGEMGENVTTHGIDLLGLSEGTLLHIGADVVVRITGLRNPCSQIDKFQSGLMAHMVEKSPDGTIVRKAGVMSVVESGGVVRPGDAIRVELPVGEQVPLQPV